MHPKKAAILTAFGLAAGLGVMYVSGDKAVPPAPKLDQPHTDPAQRNQALADTVKAFDQMRPRLEKLAPFAAELGNSDAYTDMLRQVDSELAAAAKLGSDGSIAGMRSEGVKLVTVERIDRAVRGYFDNAKIRTSFTDTLDKYPDAKTLYQEWPSHTRKIKQALGVTTPALDKNAKALTSDPLSRPLAALLPKQGPNGVQESLPFQILSAVAYEIKNQGGRSGFVSSADYIGGLLKQKAPKDTRGNSEQFHAYHISCRYLALDAEMRKQAKYYDEALARVQPHYNVNVSATLNTTRDEMAKMSEALRTHLTRNNGFNAPSCVPGKQQP